jgi:DNA-binding NtrC family response regulator
VTAPIRLLDSTERSPAGFHGMIGTHPAMGRLYDAIQRAAPLPLPVLIQGPTGSGKELVAQAVHTLSRRAGALIPVNVGAIPEHLAESELFGAVRGAYTGAVNERKGLIEAADRGTLYLDEAAELSLATQVRLLRTLEGGGVRPVGSTASRRVDFRLITSVQAPVAELLVQGRWREDFFYRVASLVLRVPSLDERASDIGLLVNHWLGEMGFDPLSPQSCDQLASRSWPGHVRQLRRAVERALFLCPGEQPAAAAILEAADSLTMPGDVDRRPPDASLKVVERAHIEAVLRRTGDTKAAARILGLSLNQLYRKYRALGIVPPRQR